MRHVRPPSAWIELLGRVSIDDEDAAAALDALFDDPNDWTLDGWFTRWSLWVDYSEVGFTCPTCSREERNEDTIFVAVSGPDFHGRQCDRCGEKMPKEDITSTI